LQPVVRSLLDCGNRFIQLEREVDRLQGDLRESRVELQDTKGQLETVTGKLPFDLVPSIHPVPF
jgi:hypothetical protein